MSIKDFVAKVGVNPYFIAFNAHCGTTAFLTLCTRGSAWFIVVALALAAYKEFVFDAQNEVPKQTTLDNLTDWLGYAAGAVLGKFAAIIMEL